MKAHSPGSDSLRKGILASLALHACGLAGLHFFPFASDEPAVFESDRREHHIEVFFTRTNPQAPSPSAEGEIADDAAVSIANGSIDKRSPNESSTDESPVPQAVPSEPRESATVLRQEEAPGQPREQGNESGDSDARKPGVSAVAISNSINTFLQEYKSDLRSDWLEECQRYRNGHGTWECPREDPAGFSLNSEERAVADSLFASITRPAYNGRRANLLRKELDFLRSLEPDNTTLEEAIETRYFLQLQKYKYLTGSGNDAYAAFEAAKANVSNAVRHEGSLNILGLGGGPSLIGAIVSLVGKDSPLAPAAGSDVIFTEYKLEKPSLPEDETEEKVFEILPPLFPVEQ